MTMTFGTMLNQMTGLFVLLVIGYLMNRLRLLPAEAETVLSRISTKLFLPALMLFTFMEECTVENLIHYGDLMLYGGIFQLTGIFVAILVAKLLAKGKNRSEFFRNCFDEICNRFLSKGVGFNPFFQEPVFHLHDRVRIIDSRQ